MITAMLAMAVLGALFWGRVPLPVLVPLCAAAGGVLAWLNRHGHSQYLTIDVYAQMSRLNTANAALKGATALALMLLCVTARTPYVGLFLTVAMLIVVVGVGGLHLHTYIHMLALPLSFLLISGLALLITVSPEASGVLAFPIFGRWLCVTAADQTRAALVMARALGAVSCLYMLSLSTPLSELIAVLRQLHCPAILVELMYLIYRYVFVLLNMYHTMRDAAKSRLGFIDYRKSVRTTGNLYSNLLARSYRQANRNFDAMESRCFETEIRFLERKNPVLRAHAGAALLLIGTAAGMAFWIR